MAPDVLAVFHWANAPAYAKASIGAQDEDNQLLRWYAQKEIVVRFDETRPAWFSDGVAEPS